MCGISGIINIDRSNVEKVEIENINNLIAHRGPDDDGFYFNENFAFGHRRLSIIDLSDMGHQPMEYNNNVITFNGEIYNYLEIKDELVELGYSFSSQTDTEVILASYLEWGFECVERFNGMWAFVIYDKSKNLLFLSRDRFGIKPLYYHYDGENIIFSSEIKGILVHPIKRRPNDEMIFDFLYYNLLDHTENTFFKRIK